MKTNCFIIVKNESICGGGLFMFNLDYSLFFLLVKGRRNQKIEDMSNILFIKSFQITRFGIYGSYLFKNVLDETIFMLFIR